MSEAPELGGRGRLIALEGIDGCGKSTQARLLAAALGADLSFEPGATELGGVLRALLLDPERPTPAPRTEALLMAADRAQHVAEIVGPSLTAGRWVVTDRFSGSTLAYQGFGRGLVGELLDAVVQFATGGQDADLSVLIDIPLEVARRRIGAVAPDRLERLDTDFHEQVRLGFLAQAKSDPIHWATVDGTLDVDSVASRIAGLVNERLGWPPEDRVP